MNDNLPLYLDSVIKNYLELLSSQGMNKEKGQAEELIKYIDKMEFQFDELLSEIKEIRTTLDAIQNPQTKSIMKSTIENITNVVQKGKTELLEIKNHVKTTIYDAVQSFKTKGKEALISSTKILKIKPALESVRKSLFFAGHSLDKSLMKANALTMEMRKAKQSFKNVGLLMMGRQANNNVDTAKLNILQKALRGMKEKTENMTGRTSSLIHKVDEYQKTSVRKNLKELSTGSDKKMIEVSQVSKENTR